jgi:hypothetical protein
MIIVQGKRYIFEVGSYNETNETEDFCFYIKAICRTAGRFSCINNLNTILSELGVDWNDPKFADSMQVVTKDEAHKFANTANEFLSDSSFLNHLEKRLDDDRKAGELETH